MFACVCAFHVCLCACCFAPHRRKLREKAQAEKAGSYVLLLLLPSALEMLFLKRPCDAKGDRPSVSHLCDRGCAAAEHQSLQAFAGEVVAGLAG